MRLLRLSRARALLAVAALAVPALVAAAPPAQANVVDPFRLRYETALYGDFATIGNAVLGCPTTPADVAADCQETLQGRGPKNNNSFVEQNINTGGMTQTFNSSTGRVTIPPGAKVTHARLYWGGNAGTLLFGSPRRMCDLSREKQPPLVLPPGDPLTTRPVVRVAGGPQTAVDVEHAVRTPEAVQGPHYYTAEADITGLFAGAPTGSPAEIAVGNVWAPTGQGCVGGWSLTVVYGYDAPNAAHAPERRQVYVYGGHVIQKSPRSRAEAATTIPVTGFLRTAGDIHASVSAYEGDLNTNKDQFLVNGQAVTEPSIGRNNNFFISRSEGALDPNVPNNLSIDAKDFEVPDGAIPQGATSANLTFTTGGDVYVPSSLALSVPVPDLRVTKRVTPMRAAPGDTLRYTITAKNISKLPYPDATFSDDLKGNLDDGKYNNDARASTGEVTYRGTTLKFKGDLAPGAEARVTYSVKLGPEGTGDGRLTNGVDVTSPRSNCDPGSTDPSCAVTPEIVRPTPPVDISTDVPDDRIGPGGYVPVVISLTNPGPKPTPPVTIELPEAPGEEKETWTGVIPAHSTVRIKHTVTAPDRPGTYSLPIVTDYRGSKCTAGSTDRSCFITLVVKPGKPTGHKPTEGDKPGSGSVPMSAAHPKPLAAPRAQIAETGPDYDRTQLLTGISLLLTALGVLAVAATRSRRS
ncbi:hypothetical protein [Streptomyces sp. NPDC051561]|uniref:DUF7927 domain-containing protein n=1 Tax=Streptomyces sp. NPDC051561 TaxID=3365658 RepID=UPI0037B2C090